MVNGPKQVYIERRGQLELTDVSFQNDEHVLNIARRIVSQIGRRVEETTPLVDARLMDGSRVNIIIPPLAIDAPRSEAHTSDLQSLMSISYAVFCLKTKPSSHKP